MPLDGRVLALEDARRAGEVRSEAIHAGGLHDAAVLGEVAVQHRQAAVGAKGVRDVADGAVVAVQVGRVSARTG